ncbi:MAG: glycosyltransferase family 4 protein [Solirubrobacterales bacterium]|nr:glycosyltransferase family 4 protein [Solirubrobacterales bacterium]
MRLLAVCQVDEPGGAEVALLRLLPRLVRRGWDVTLTSPGPGALAEAGFPWLPLEVGGLAHGAGARAVASWPRARGLSKEHDVTYLNGTVAGRLLPALRGHRTVLHVHDIVDRVPRHWQGADTVLAASQAVADRLTGLRPHVVYCPIELDLAPAPAPWPPGGGPVIGFVGRIEPRKGPLDLALAAPAIRAVHPDARIVLLGDDTYDADPDYAAQVRAADGVEHLGHVAGAAAVMGHLDVLVAPSRQEPFGTVLSEAMAAGTPVVATAVDGLPEVVDHDVTGMLVVPGDVPALAAAVLQVLERRDAMGAAAREAVRRFDADAYADHVERLLLDPPVPAGRFNRRATDRKEAAT